eukprot:scaffold25203_cov118-Isochrysis_galbana.AAC.3
MESTVHCDAATERNTRTLKVATPEMVPAAEKMEPQAMALPKALPDTASEMVPLWPPPPISALSCCGPAMAASRFVTASSASEMVWMPLIESSSTEYEAVPSQRHGPPNGSGMKHEEGIEPEADSPAGVQVSGSWEGELDGGAVGDGRRTGAGLGWRAEHLRSGWRRGARGATWVEEIETEALVVKGIIDLSLERVSERRREFVGYNVPDDGRKSTDEVNQVRGDGVNESIKGPGHAAK